MLLRGFERQTEVEILGEKHRLKLPVISDAANQVNQTQLFVVIHTYDVFARQKHGSDS